MKLSLYDDAGAFQQAVLLLLMRHEAENNLMIGIVKRLADGTANPWSNEPPLLGTVEQDGEIIAAVMQTPPHNLVLTRMTAEVVDLIADQLRDRLLPGMLGPKETAAAFTAAWQAHSGTPAILYKDMRIYQLDTVISPPPVTGYPEEATLDDLTTLLPWLESFHQDTGTRAGDVEQAVRRYLEGRQILLWKDPIPVTMAMYAGPTPNGVRISGVYTPPEYRRLGYASANVAALSQRLLNSGYRFCYLFTDLANPISNSIYQKIGYRPVCDFDEYRFGK